MKIIIAGGSGFLGNALIEHFLLRKVEVVVLARQLALKIRARQVVWDGCTFGPWVSELEGADVLINLCGKSVDCRYTRSNKAEIYRSRIQPTTILAQALAACAHPPHTWINASSATIYRASHQKLMDEFTGELGDDFSEDVCRNWEGVVQAFNRKDVRTIILRIAITLGKHKGALLPLSRLTKMGLGGKQGTGSQRVSWVHLVDFCRAVEWVITNPSAAGIYNLVAPQTVSNNEFMQQLRLQLGRPFGFTIPVWLLELGAIFMRTESELVLKSRNVYPARLLEAGFDFSFPKLDAALADCVGH